MSGVVLMCNLAYIGATVLNFGLDVRPKHKQKFKKVAQMLAKLQIPPLSASHKRIL